MLTFLKLFSTLANPLVKVAVPLAKNAFAPLGMISAVSAIDAGIQKKIHSSGCHSSFASCAKTLIISNKEMNETMKIVQALEDSNILLKGVTKTIKNKTKEQKGGFLRMFLGTLRASLLGNLFEEKGIVRVGSGNKKEKRIVRVGYGKEWDF